MKIKYLHSKILLFLFVTVFSFNGNCQDKDNPWLIGFGVNAVDHYSANKKDIGKFFDYKNYNYIKAPSKLSLARYLSPSFNVELSGSINKITKNRYVKAIASDKYIAIDANAIYDANKIIGETGWFDPYLLGGFGFNYENSESAISYNGGAGAKLWFTDKFGAKVQTVLKYFTGDSNYRHFQHSASLIYKFGGYDEDNDGVYDKNDKCPSVFGLAEFNGCPDSDDDGIQDSEDKCPNVFGLASLAGCPDADGDGVTDKEDRCVYIKGIAKHGGCPDSDGDGIIDQRDACPTKSGPLSNKGCPELDTDGDGVVDKYDKCKFEKGVLSNNGCPKVNVKKNLEKKLTELASSILFKSGSDVFYKQYESNLNQIAELMSGYKDLKFQIQGHTDSQGAEEANLDLSRKRVNKVLNYLVTRGVNQLNLNVKGFGESMPIATNETAEGRAANRRVEIKIID
ncbi:Outer membrane protein OmpA [Lutibacter oricola]|uniref:Outer membrane protein OmpA n=1 Tax=Lutibacter oricola TaxID=762486 RepID=A0A1H3D9U8_9FLAO|nr:OmpA family protein [Lutibacter oricola]SDX63292.1 Outer membrane protein OmpA [Lutibacter oricola]